ncbi:hypothetical protein [uncultured Polaribacter sp.]|uniref:hypothetical protein n=1 Tax=uncultured Polaribacter sp. TaxID=174711 RepID=UPI002618C613|nr:hypothetical protein [uncultured Polaribacter sp.]
MLNRYYLFLITSLLFFSCSKQSEISKEFGCKTSKFKNLEIVEDFRRKFEIELPKSWKTNLYYDKLQSSIYTADTTKQLTETILLDISYINDKINFDDEFSLKQEQEHLAKGLIKTKSKQITLLKKPSMHFVYKGKKGNFKYQISNIFIKIDPQNFILAKTEIYGDSLVNEKLCNSFSLIENIKIHQKND